MLLHWAPFYHDRKKRVFYRFSLSVISERAWKQACILSLSFYSDLWEFLSDKRMYYILTFPYYIRDCKNVSAWQHFIFTHWKSSLCCPRFESYCHIHLYCVVGFCVTLVVHCVFITILKFKLSAFTADRYLKLFS